VYKYRFPIFLAVSIGLFNQLSGINAILYYLNTIFADAGFSKVSGDLQSVAIGATNLLFTMIAMSVIDRIGRKTLLLVGSVGTAACLAGVAAIFFLHRHQDLLVWLLVGYIAFFAFSQGAVIWVFISEVDHERRDFPGVPADGGALRRISICVFFADDGPAVLCGGVRVPGNQGRHAGRNAEKTRHCLTVKVHRSPSAQVRALADSARLV
jgi:hypothetical protein